MVWTTKYSDELAKEICETVSTSAEMLETLCAKNPHWPAAKTIYMWRLENDQFNDMFLRAKRNQIEPLVSRIFTLTSDGDQDLYHDGTKYCVNNARVARIKIEVDAIKWLAGKLSPRLYGQKIGAEGEDNLLILSELKKAKTYEDKIECILQAVADGKITSRQGNELANIVEKMCRTYETSEAKPLVEELKRKHKAKS